MIDERIKNHFPAHYRNTWSVSLHNGLSIEISYVVGRKAGKNAYRKNRIIYRVNPSRIMGNDALALFNGKDTDAFMNKFNAIIQEISVLLPWLNDAYCVVLIFVRMSTC